MRIPIISKKLIIVAGIAFAIIAGVIGLQLVTYTTSNAAYCLNCHGTGETRDVSKASKIHPSYDQVSCVQCHAKPGQFIPEGYKGGFSADPNNISNNCIRCHSDIPNKNTQDGFKYNVLSIRIPHKFHLETAGATCTQCHANIAHDREDPPTNRPRMDYCFTCHQGADRACDKCHTNGIPSPAGAATPATGQAISGRDLFSRNCSICHGDKGDQLEKANLRSKDFIQSFDDRTLRQVIVNGKGAMPAVSVTQGVNLNDDQVQALVTYVKSLSQEASTAPSALTEGRDLYNARCSACHGAKGDQVSSANLGSKDFLEGRGDATLLQSTAKGKGAMPAQGQGSGGQLTDAQINEIIVYLKYIANATPSTAPAAGPSREGMTLYTKNCAACHGDNGATLGSANLRSKSFVGSRSDDALAQAIANGKGNMPPFGTGKGGPLTDAQVKDLVEYIKTLAVDP